MLSLHTTCSQACGCHPSPSSFLAVPSSVSQFHCCTSQLGKGKLGDRRCAMCMHASHSHFDVCRSGGMSSAGGSSCRSPVVCFSKISPRQSLLGVLMGIDCAFLLCDLLLLLGLFRGGTVCMLGICSSPPLSIALRALPTQRLLQPCRLVPSLEHSMRFFHKGS